MYVRQLALINFRNYVRCLLDLAPGATVFYGENGQGKTNLLEAIYILATTKSFRTSNDRELLSWHALQERMPFARLEARVVRADGEVHSEIRLRGEPGPDEEGALAVSKSLKVNGLPVRAAQLMGQLNAVIFSPEDLALVSGPPAGRRRYLDITQSQVDPHYLRALQRYQRVLAQRNHLLRQVRERRQDRAALAIWDDELVSLGCQIIGQRLRLIQNLNGAMADGYRHLTRSERTLEIRYQATSQPGLGVVSNEEARAAFRSSLARVQPREIEQGVSLVGPHRDDFSFLVDGVDMSAFGSRGEQRLVVVALKLAEALVMRDEVQDSPVLLLDDVLSELDPRHRQFVQERIVGDYQTIMTVADLSTCSDLLLAGASLYRVERGTLTRDVAGVS